MKLLVVLATALAGFQPVEAGALFWQLPKDGSWAEYYIQIDLRGDETTGTLTVRSVGTEKFLGKDCRWIEMELKLPEKLDIKPGLVKILVPESAFTAERAVKDETLKGYYRNAEGEITEFSDITQVHLTFFRQFCTGKLDNVQQEEIDKTLSYQHGDLELEKKIAGKKSSTLVFSAGENSVKWKVTSDYTLVPHPKVPFGIAEYAATHRIEVRDRKLDVSVKLTLTNTGSEAKSALPEKQ